MIFAEALETLAETLWKIDNKEDFTLFLEDLCTPSEVVELGDRIAIFKLVLEGKTQREIAEELGISVTTVSRGARVIKYGKGAASKRIKQK